MGYMGERWMESKNGTGFFGQKTPDDDQDDDNNAAEL